MFRYNKFLLLAMSFFAASTIFAAKLSSAENENLYLIPDSNSTSVLLYNDEKHETIYNNEKHETTDRQAVVSALPPVADEQHIELESHGQFVDFPEEHAPLSWEIGESIPTILTWPHDSMAHFYGCLINGEHVELESALHDHPIGIQPIPERPPLIFEWNDNFLQPGFLSQGLEMPSGVVLRPSLWVFGEFRTAFQYYENQRTGDPIVEWANRLDLFAQLNLSGTERILVGIRPLDEERVNSRLFSGYDFFDGDEIDGFNGDFQTAFFEGDFGEIFPWLDPYDTCLLDLGFSVGRMPLLAQQGLLINEDAIDAVTVTRNTLNGHGNLNLRTTGVFSWDSINRNSPTISPPNNYDPSSKMYALLTESDFFHNTVNFDVVYVNGNDNVTGDMVAFGASAIRRHHGYHNTYNTSLHVLGSYPVNDTTPFADQGELLFAQTSWTPHHAEDLIYLNGFLAIDQFTSPARGPLVGSPLGQTGILFAAVGLGRYAPAVLNNTNNTAGASLGYQMFYDGTRTQLIWEVGGIKETEGPTNRGMIGTAWRYQKALGQHFIFVVDTFISKREGVAVSQGARTELLIRF